MAQSWRPWEPAGTQPLSTGDVNKAINLPPALPPTTQRPTNVTLPSISSLLGEPLRDENTAAYGHDKHRAAAFQPPRPHAYIPPTVHLPTQASSGPFRNTAPPPFAHPIAQHRPVAPHTHHAPAPLLVPASVSASAPVPTSISSSASASTTAASKPTRKRKSDVLEDPQGRGQDDAPDSIDCDHLRAKIRALTMTLEEFGETIGCPADELAHFMSRRGLQAGWDSPAVRKAADYFKSRQPSAGPTQPEPSRAPKTGNKRTTKVVPALDVSGITLDGEADQSVKVFDTCDKVRRKINRFLADHDNVTASAFCREIAKALPNDRKVQSKQLNDFLAKKGPTAGNTSCVYYTAYVFFEKRRIKDRRPKDQTRTKMEEIHPDGMNTTELLNYVTVFRGEEPVMDEYGRVHYVTPGGKGL